MFDSYFPCCVCEDVWVDTARGFIIITVNKWQGTSTLKVMSDFFTVSLDGCEPNQAESKTRVVFVSTVFNYSGFIIIHPQTIILIAMLTWQQLHSLITCSPKPKQIRERERQWGPFLMSSAELWNNGAVWVRGALLKCVTVSAWRGEGGLLPCPRLGVLTHCDKH